MIVEYFIICYLSDVKYVLPERVHMGILFCKWWPDGVFSEGSWTVIYVIHSLSPTKSAIVPSYSLKGSKNVDVVTSGICIHWGSFDNNSKASRERFGILPP